MLPKTMSSALKAKRVCFTLGIILVTTLLFVLLASLALASFNKTGWKFYREITDASVTVDETDKTNKTGNGYSTVRLDEQVYNRCKEALEDLRIIDGSGKEVPYKSFQYVGDQRIDEQDVTMTNLSVIPGATSFTLDIGDRQWTHNQLALWIENKDFVARVKVEGSTDKRKWSNLSEKGFIYDMDRKVGLQVENKRVTYPDTDYRFLRITISNNDNIRISVKGAHIERMTNTPSREREVIKTGVVLRKDKDRSFAMIDLKHRQPISHIEITGKDTNYYRHAFVSGSNNARTWTQLGDGMIYEFDTPSYKSSKTTIYCMYGSYRYIELSIMDADDQPLEIDAVQVFDYERSLFFKTQSKPLFLYYGNAKASAPTYDIEKVFPFIDADSAKPMKLGAEKSNPLHIAPVKPWTERNPELFWSLLIAAGVALAVLSFRLMRQITFDKE